MCGLSTSTGASFQGTQSPAHASRFSSSGVHDAAGEPLRADMPPHIDIVAFPLLWQNVTPGPKAISEGRCGPWVHLFQNLRRHASPSYLAADMTPTLV